MRAALAVRGGVARALRHRRLGVVEVVRADVEVRDRGVERVRDRQRALGSADNLPVQRAEPHGIGHPVDGDRRAGVQVVRVTHAGGRRVVVEGVEHAGDRMHLEPGHDLFLPLVESVHAVRGHPAVGAHVAANGAHRAFR